VLPPETPGELLTGVDVDGVDVDGVEKLSPPGVVTGPLPLGVVTPLTPGLVTAPPVPDLGVVMPLTPGLVTAPELL
jgi:hypothetical protein